MKRFFLLSLAVVFSYIAMAQIPNGYYNGTEGLTGSTLKSKLSTIISTGYSGVSYNGLWNAYKTTDKRADGKVWDIYTDNCNFVFVTDQCGSYSNICDCYNREHTVPQSWFNSASPMVSDLYHVLPTDGKVNGVRGNYPYGECTGGTVYGLGRRGSCTFPGYSGTVFEPADEYKGDVARIYFYMATRYLSQLSSWSGESFTGNDISTWSKALFLKWHNQDPVSQKEIDRNNAAYAIQKNRNPYVDHPEWACEVFGSNCTTNPTIVASASTLTGFSYSVGSGPSTSKTYTLNASNLVGSGNVTVTGSTNFEVSSNGTDYSASISFPYANGIITSQPKTVNVRLKAGLAEGSYNSENIVNAGGTATSVNVICSGTVNPNTPLLTTTPTSLNGYSYVVGAGPSVSKSFVLSGTNLTGSQVTVTAPANYEISNDNSVFTNTFNISYTAPTLNNTTIYVRLKAGLSVASFNNENVSCDDNGTAPTINVSNSGNVISGGSSSICISEGFAGGATAPTDWTFTNFAAADVYTSAGNFGAASPSLKFNATGDIVETPTVANPTQLKFWIKGQTATGSTLLVEGYNGSSWVTIESILMTSITTGTTKTYNSISTPALISGFTKFRFTYNKVTSNVSFDDVEVTCGNSTIPTIVSTQNNLDFGNNCINSIYGPNSFTINGSDLSTENITISALDGYIFSTTSNGTYTSTLSLSQTGGTFSQQIFVKFNPLIEKTYSGVITISGGGAIQPVNVNLTGNGINTLPLIENPLSSDVTTTTAILSADISDKGCTNVTERGFYYSTTDGFLNGEGTEMIEYGTFANGSFTANLINLEPATTYYYKAYAANDGGNVYSAQGSFTTLPTSVNEISDSKIIIYPNPTKGIFYLVTPVNLNVTLVKITDITGRTIQLSNKFVDNKMEINLQENPQGVYTVEIHSDNKVYYHKLILQK